MTLTLRVMLTTLFFLTLFNGHTIMAQHKNNRVGSLEEVRIFFNEIRFPHQNTFTVKNFRERACIILVKEKYRNVYLIQLKKNIEHIVKNSLQIPEQKNSEIRMIIKIKYNYFNSVEVLLYHDCVVKIKNKFYTLEKDFLETVLEFFPRGLVDSQKQQFPCVIH